MKEKRIPLRKCVGCGQMKPKSELIRVVRDSAGSVSLDPVGKKPGPRAPTSAGRAPVWRRRGRRGGWRRRFRRRLRPRYTTHWRFRYQSWRQGLRAHRTGAESRQARRRRRPDGRSRARGPCAARAAGCGRGGKHAQARVRQMRALQGRLRRDRLHTRDARTRRRRRKPVLRGVSGRRIRRSLPAGGGKRPQGPIHAS